MDKQTLKSFFLMFSSCESTCSSNGWERKYSCITLALSYSYVCVVPFLSHLVHAHTHVHLHGNTRTADAWPTTWNFIMIGFVLKSFEHQPTQGLTSWTWTYNCTSPQWQFKCHLSSTRTQKEKNMFVCECVCVCVCLCVCVCVAGTCNSIAQQKSCGGKSPRRHYMSASPSYC